MKRKAQIQMGETMVILIIFIFLVSFGLIAYVKFQSESFEEKRSEQTGLLATEVALRVLYLPELQCSHENVPVHNCIDLMKLVAFSQSNPEDFIILPVGFIPTENPVSGLPSNELYYFDMFGYGNVTIKLTEWDGAVLKFSEPYVIYEKSPENLDTVEVLKTFIPVSTFNPLVEEQKFGYGILEVNSYRQRLGAS